ncbi:MAG TPA: sodium:proton exchanger [Acidimicrobiia bacterium]|nr:sodium:proton exchanger [Acidimicrobiia bacterium]
MTSGTVPSSASGRDHQRGQLLAIGLAFLATLPGLLTRLAGYHPPAYVAPVAFGLAILGSAFLLAWAAEVLQLDVSQGLSLTVLALIAVLPEYAVDFAFASKAGQDPDKYAPLALANMTGANRLLIGVGWSMVVLLAAWRITRIARRRGYRGEIDTDVHLERPHAIEISFLALATVYSLTLPFKSTLTLVDSAVLISIFVVFVFRIARSPAEEPHLVGPARLVGSLPVVQRRVAVGVLLAYAAAVIFMCAEPFAESLVHVGEQAGVDTFLLVQWLAPLASEAPELLVAGLFAWRLQTSAGLGTLLSSKVNQWTLLVGSLPIVFAVSAGALHGLPLDSLQREELFLTAAQSVFAIAVLANRSMSVREAWMLFGLFMFQFVLGGVLPEHLAEYERIAVGVLYLVLAAFFLFRERTVIRPLVHDGLREPVEELFREDEPAPVPPWAQDFPS